MTPVEAQRHVKAICNDLNQGKEILSRQAAFLLGLTVKDIIQNEHKTPSLRAACVRKDYGRVKIYNKQSILTFFNNYKAFGSRGHVYIGKRMDSKEAKALLQLAYESLV